MLNPIYILLLGILLLLGLLFYYFYNKIREQNEKITNMFSLLSILADNINYNRDNIILPDINPKIGEKMGDNNLDILEYTKNNNNNNNNNLIEVSDDDVSINDNDNIDNDDSDNDDSDNDDSDNDNSDNDNSDNDNSDNDEDDIKILNLNINSGFINIDDDINNDVPNFDSENSTNLEDLNDNIPELSLGYLENSLPLIDNNTIQNNDFYESSSELNDLDKIQNKTPSTIFSLDDNIENESKTIKINLDEINILNLNKNEVSHNEEHLDYKKMSISKLKNLVLERGLIQHNEINKLKKNDLINILNK
jgi:hypothetical protein